MEYHLHHQGRNLGVFSLDELRRRRGAGELSGNELVWRQGMTNWQPLDSLLQSSEIRRPVPPPLPVPRPARRSHRATVWITAAVTTLIVIYAVFFAAFGRRFVQQFRVAQQTARQITRMRGSSSEGLEVASRAITVPTNSATENDLRKRGKEFRIRQWLTEYKERGVRNPRWDADAVRLLELWIAKSYDEDLPTNQVSVEQLGDKLAINGACDDPLILTAAAINSIELHEKDRRLERALKLFEGSTHRAYPQFYANVSLASDGSTRWRALESAALGFFKECFTDGSFLPEDQPELAEILLNGWGYDFFWRNAEKVQATTAEQGKAFEWLALVLEGERHVAEAWKARGGGYANTVNEKGWEGFSSHSALARGAFTNAWQLRPDLPQAAARMVYVAMGDSDAQEMRLWFDRALAAQIDYPRAWTDMRWGLRPRWHGSTEALLALGVAAVETRRFDTDVPRKFFDVVADVESEEEGRSGQHLYGRSDIWTEFQRMYEGYIAEPTQTNYQAGWRTSYAVVAFLGGKYDVARAQLETLNWKPQSLAGWGTDLSLMPFEVSARTSGLGRKIADAEFSRNRGHVSDALRIYKEQAGATDLDERTMKFVRHRIASLEMEERLQSGQWVDFAPTDDEDLNWVSSRGKHRRLADGTVEVEADAGGHMLVCRSRVGATFEVKGEFELVHSSTKDFQAGLLIGMPEFETSDWYGFRMKRNQVEGQIATFAIGWTKKETFSPVALNDDRNSFRFVLRNGGASAWVNGKEVLKEAKAPRTLSLAPSEYLLGLGAFNDMNQTVIRYRNVQVRRLSR